MLRVALVCRLVLLLMLGVASRAAKDIPLFDVKVVSGEAARLPCDISTGDTADSVLLVLWYREDLGTPVYSMDGRERDFTQAERWSDDTVFGSRAYFLADKNPSALAVENVNTKDEGVYRCRVDFKVAQTRNSKVNLTVIVPPRDLVIMDEKGVNRTSVVGPYSEAESLRLMCDVFGGKPMPVVEWFRDERLETNATTVVSEGRVRSELVLQGLTRKDLHTSLRCRASNNDRRPPKEAAVLVDMNLRPLDIRLLGASQPLSAGRRYDLLCQSSGSRPPARITWWLNGKRLDRSKETTSNDGNTTTSTLSWVAAKEDAGRNLSCRAENPGVGGNVLEDKATLEIQYIPEAVLQLGTSLNPDNIREGADVYFDCIINAMPPVYKVEWRHNGRIMGPGAGRGFIVSNQSLVLQSVGRSGGGNYTCVGVNSEGAGESAPFNLNILYVPTCKPNQSRVIGVAKQERANISCEVDANPSNVTFRWTFNNSAENLDVATAHIARAGPVSYVSYTPVTELDYGTLLCWASNHIGHQRVPCVFHIIAAGRPDQVHNCSVGNMSTHSFTIRCAEGFNGGLPQSFLLEIRDAHTQAVKANVTAGVATFSVSGLLPGERYQACVYSYNLKGRSEPVVLAASTMRSPERHLTASVQERPRPSTMFTPALSLVAGVLTAMLILGGAIALILKLYCSQRNHHHRHKRAGAGVTDLQNPQANSKSTSPAVTIKNGGSPGGKMAANDSVDSDEKNPDIIPQANKVEADNGLEDYLRRRQHISTIETSPTRGLIHQQGLHCVSGMGGGYSGYCTLRNGLPLRDLAMKAGECAAASAGMMTLPRHWPTAGYGGPLHHPLYPGPLPLHVHQQIHHSHPRLHPAGISEQPIATIKASVTASSASVVLLPPSLAVATVSAVGVPPSVDEQTSTDSPVLPTKRESTV